MSASKNNIRSKLFFVAVLPLLVLAHSVTVQAQPSAADSAFAIPASNEGLPGVGPIRRMDWFQRLWLERRTKWAETLEADQGAVVFLGDSITQGWGDRLETTFSGYKVANRGISGDTSRGVLIRLDEDVLAVNPKAVVLLIGTNDLEESASPDEVARNVELTLDEITAKFPDIPILLNEVFPSSTEMRRPSQQIQEINAMYRDIAANYPQVTVLGTFAVFDGGDGDAEPELFPDMLHLNEAGYAQWAEVLSPALDNLFK